MRRVAVVGGSCSGKTSVVRRLSQILGAPHVELDALHHGPNWNEAPADVLRGRVRDALESAPNGWVVDGNCFGKLGGFVFERADTVVWLDVPYATAICRVLWRTFSCFATRAELWNGNRERLRDTFGRNSIVWWVLRTRRGFAKKWDARLAEHPNLEIVRLRTSHEVRDWLQSIQATASTSGSSNGSERQKTPPFVET